ncbi:MAG TPA: hypothetical protein VF059_10905 [Casimicrobiaceae bacterium]
MPLTSAAETKNAPVVRRPLDASSPPVAGAPLPVAPSPAVAGGPIGAHTDAVYVCVIDKQGERTRTAVELTPKVAALCRRHPEMGPCQYERETCRRAGGRVYAANGEEITQRTEAEYDRKVMRARFRAN